MVVLCGTVLKFLSTPSARRATARVAAVLRSDVISIHALREEGDGGAGRGPAGHGDFYPRPPRGGRQRSKRGRVLQNNFYPRPPRGGRLAHAAESVHDGRFLSTPSARRATSFGSFFLKMIFDFYPRPPRGGRRKISTSMIAQNAFLSTPSARRATFPT